MDGDEERFGNSDDYSNMDGDEERFGNSDDYPNMDGDEERFGNNYMLKEAPTGSCGTSDFAPI